MKRVCFLLLILALAASFVAAQNTQPSPDDAKSATSGGKVMIPAGTQVPIVLKQALTTKSARPGDPVYAATSFPVVDNGRIIIPAGTYVQGRISSVKRGGTVKGRAEILIHFTTLIYPSGYTVMLPGSIEGVPGSERTNIKDEEGTIQQSGQKGHELGTAAKTAGTGAVIGAAATRSVKGAGIGGAAGGVAGLAIGMLTRDKDVRMEAGSSLEMVIQRDVPLDANRLPSHDRNGRPQFERD
jgi:type IV secretion system protein VirB10